MQEDGTTGYGGVGYDYSIARNDVTNSQYVEFLNAKDPDGANLLGLYNSNMSAFPLGGIIFNVMASAGSHYHTSDAGNHPVNDVTWYSAVRFANWMNNGQGNGDTETGSYSLGQLDSNGVPVDGFGITRSAATAHVVLPSEDEWYKAAYYDPRTTAKVGRRRTATTGSMAPAAIRLPPPKLPRAEATPRTTTVFSAASPTSAPTRRP